MAPSITQQRLALTLLYLVAVSIWIGIFAAFDALTLDFGNIFFLGFPILLLVICYVAAIIDPSHTGPAPTGFFVSISFIVVSVIINWNTGNQRRKAGFIKIVIVALTLVTLSLLTLVAPRGWDFILWHVQAISAALGLFLVLFALYRYYWYQGIDEDTLYRAGRSVIACEESPATIRPPRRHVDGI